MDIKKLNDKEVNNLIQFLDMLDDDELMGFLTDILDGGSEHSMGEEPIKTILTSFSDKLMRISKLSN